MQQQLSPTNKLTPVQSPPYNLRIVGGCIPVKIFACWVIFHAFFCHWPIFFFLKNSFRVSNSLDLDQARHFVGPDLGPNCLPRLSADGTSRQRVKVGVDFRKMNYNKKRKNYQLWKPPSKFILWLRKAYFMLRSD